MKSKIFIYSLLAAMFYVLFSCKNPAQNSVTPNEHGPQKTNNAYTVVYNANGGKGEMQESVFAAGAWESLPPNAFTNEAYLFTGWALSTDGNVVYADKSAVLDLAVAGKSVTLYAQWGN